MKQFNLEEYLANPSRKVVTKDGNNVRIVCTDVKSELYPVLALVDNGKEEISTRYTKDGKFISNDEYPCDLLFANEKHEGWINVYRDTDTGTTSFGAVLYASRKDAEEVGKPDEYYVATAKIEWEE